MAKPYSMDLRERAMARVAAGESTRKAAAAHDELAKRLDTVTPKECKNDLKNSGYASI